MQRSTGLRRLGAGVGAGIGVYAVSLVGRAAHGIYLSGYPKERRKGPQGWSAMQDGGYRAP